MWYNWFPWTWYNFVSKKYETNFPMTHLEKIQSVDPKTLDWKEFECYSRRYKIVGVYKWKVFFIKRLDWQWDYEYEYEASDQKYLEAIANLIS